MIDRNRVLLVYPPNQLMRIETPRPDGSLGLLYLASALRNVGFSVDVLDASVGTLEDCLEETFYRSIELPSGLVRIGVSNERLANIIALGNYGLVGISSNFTPQTRMALEVAAMVRSVNSEILVVAGGVNARNLAERFLSPGQVDVVCLSEGEVIFRRIAEAWRSGKDFRDLSGIAFWHEEKVVRRAAEPSDIAVDLDILPFPAWEMLPSAHYERIASPHGVTTGGDGRYASLMTSRGCPYHCAYCHISMERSGSDSGGLGRLRLQSVGRVIAEVDYLQSLGVRRLYFEDDSLLAKKERVRQIFRAVVGRGLKIANVNGVNLTHFLCRQNGRLEIDREYLELLASSGFTHVVFPVESGSQRVLDTYATAKLNHADLDVVELVRQAKRAGISCPVNMMIGFPDESEAEMCQSIELAKRLVEAGAEYCTFFVPIPFPGSRLFELALAGGYLEREFDPDCFNWKNVVMSHTLVSPERIAELRDRAWREVNTKEHVRMRLEASIGSRFLTT